MYGMWQISYENIKKKNYNKVVNNNNYSATIVSKNANYWLGQYFISQKFVPPNECLCNMHVIIFQYIRHLLMQISLIFLQAIFFINHSVKNIVLKKKSMRTPSDVCMKMG